MEEKTKETKESKEQEENKKNGKKIKKALIIECEEENCDTIEALVAFLEVLTRKQNKCEMSWYYGECSYSKQGKGIWRRKDGNTKEGKFTDDYFFSSLQLSHHQPFSSSPSFFSASKNQLLTKVSHSANNTITTITNPTLVSTTNPNLTANNNINTNNNSNLNNTINNPNIRNNNVNNHINYNVNNVNNNNNNINNNNLNNGENGNFAVNFNATEEELNLFGLETNDEREANVMMLPKETGWITLKPSYGKFHVLSSFPDDLLLYIFSFLDLKALVRVSQVCTEWRRLTNEKRLWKLFYSLHFSLQSKSSFPSSNSLQSTPTTIEKAEEEEKVTIDWKEKVKKWYILDRNWRTGEFLASNLRGHTALVTGLDFYSNKLVSSSYDGTVRLWNTQTGNTLLVLTNNTPPSTFPLLGSPPPPTSSSPSSLSSPSPPPPVWCVKFAIGEQKVFTGSSDSKIRVWDLATTKCIAQYRKHLGGVKMLQVDQEKIITGSDDKTIKLFDIKSGQCVKTIQQLGAVSSLYFHQHLLFSATKMSPKIQTVDLRTGKVLEELTTNGHSKSVYSLYYNPHTKLLASGGRDKQIILWDVTSNSVYKKFQGHRFSIMSLQIDDEKIVSGSADNTIRIWDIESGSCRQILHQGHNQMITALKFDEEKIVSGSADRTLIVADFSAKLRTVETKFDFFS